MNKIFGKTWPADTAMEIIGSILSGIAVYNFAVPAGFPMTGFSGLSLILYRLFGLPIGVTTLVLNIPVAVLCCRMIGRQFFFRSLRCMIISSVFIDYAAPLLPQYSGDVFVAAVCVGVLGGLGYAMIYMRGSSTGGSDFIVLALKARHPHLPLGTFIFVTDCAVVVFGGILFRDFDGIVYGSLIGFVFALISDKIMYGLNKGKFALIVTDYGEAVTKCIDELCGRGTTIVDARGGYRSDHRDVVMCACSDKEMFLIARAIKKLDPASFTVILESNEVHGEGFRTVQVAEPENEEN